MPITLHGGRDDDNGLLDLLRLEKPVEVGTDLDGLPEAHVVTKDATQVLLEKVIQPGNAQLLMFEQVRQKPSSR